MKMLTAIQLPIDFGHTKNGGYDPQGQRQSPAVLLEELRNAGVPLRHTIEVPVDGPLKDEAQSCPLKFDREIEQAIRSAVTLIEKEIVDGKMPLILGGDHCISLATALAVSKTLRRQRLGAIVFDAHTDFNKPGKVPESGIPTEKGQTFSGNAHGMIHALLARQGDEAFDLARLCKEFSLFDPARVVMIGVRSQRYPDLQETLDDLKPKIISVEEAEAIDAMDAEQKAKELTKIISIASANFKEPFYLSLDCDAISPQECPAVATAVAGGLTFNCIKNFLNIWRGDYRFWQQVKAIDIAEYCPNLDDNAASAKKIAELFSMFFNEDQHS